MDLNVWLAYVAACLVLTMTPGPSILLGVVHSLSYGSRHTLYTALGDISANLIQMVLVGVGLGVVVAASDMAFALIKWAGVATLLYLGLKTFFAGEPAGPGLDGEAGPVPTHRRLYVQGFMVAAGNPKAIVFFTAFFPQFINPAHPVFPQLVIMCPTMSAMDFFWVMAYSLCARRAATAIARHPMVVNRIGGSVLVGASLILAMVSRSRH